MEWFYGIKRLINLRKIKKTQRGFVTADQEVYLGTTLQQVAAFCLLENSAQFKIVSELLEENPETKRPEHIKVKKV
jgi:hypothetical protein